MQSRQAVCAAASSPLLAARPVSRQQAKAPCCHLGVIGQSRTTRGFLRSSRPQRDLDLLLACSAADRDPECEVVTEPAGTSSSDPDEQPPAALDVSSSSPATLAQHALRSFFSPTKLLAALPLLGLFGGTDAGISSPLSSGTVQACLVLATIITIHEAGHFFAARLQNIHVQEFSVGFGPQLLKYKGKDVTYSLRALPLGGYVGFPDEDPQSKIPKDDPNLLKNRPILDRAIVLSAGVVFNIIFAWSILFTQANTVGMVEAAYQPGIVVGSLNQATPGAKAALHRGDVIVNIDGEPLRGRSGDVTIVKNAIVRHPEHELQLQLRRGKELTQVMVTPELDSNGDGRLGVHLGSNVKYRHTKADSLPMAAGAASKALGRCFSQVVGGLQQMVTNFGGVADSISGPVGVVAAGAEAAKQDPAGLFQFAAIINVNLAVINTLPLPALDGGYLALLAVEAVRGKKLSKNLEQGILASGVLLLMSLSFFLIVRDTLNLTG